MLAPRLKAGQAWNIHEVAVKQLDISARHEERKLAWLSFFSIRKIILCIYFGHLFGLSQCSRTVFKKIIIEGCSRLCLIHTQFVPGRFVGLLSGLKCCNSESTVQPTFLSDQSWESLCVERVCVKTWYARTMSFFRNAWVCCECVFAESSWTCGGVIAMETETALLEGSGWLCRTKKLQKKHTKNRSQDLTMFFCFFWSEFKPQGDTEWSDQDRNVMCLYKRCLFYNNMKSLIYCLCHLFSGSILLCNKSINYWINWEDFLSSIHPSSSHWAIGRPHPGQVASPS